jgi:DNA-binding transcriptional LysR family regulator
MVIFSNKPIPRQLKAEDLFKFDWICRDEESHTRKLAAEIFEEIGVACTEFNVIGVLSSPTSIKETVMHAPADAERPVVSIMSRHVISDEVMSGRLYEARLKNYKIVRKLYIAYSKERKHDAFIDNVVNYLLTIKV